MKCKTCIPSLVLVAFSSMMFFGCASQDSQPATNPSYGTQPPPKVSLMQELKMHSCPEGSLQGVGTAEDYDQALNIAVMKIAQQIQSSVKAANTSIRKEEASSDGSEGIQSSFEMKSQVSTQLRNMQDVHPMTTLARDGMTGVVACMSREDAAKPYRQDYQSARDALVSSMAVLDMTTHPLEKFSNYDIMVDAYRKYKDAVLVLESIGFKDGYGDIEENYKKSLEGYNDFKSRYKIYYDGSLEAEEATKIFQELSKKVFLQTMLDSACEVGLVLSLELSDPRCKEGGLGITCTEVVALNGSSCSGETYFTLGATLKGVGRFDENEAKSKIVNSIDKGDLIAEWMKELGRWIAR